MEKLRILVEEGLGAYKYKPGPCSDLHPHGRLGAKLTVFRGGEVIFETRNASTLPDGISLKYKALMNNDIAIPFQGTYKIYTHRHRWRSAEKYRAFQLGDYSESIPVARLKRKSSASGINLHYRSGNDDWRSSPTYMWSSGCITVDEADMKAMRNAIGLDGEDYDKHILIGEIEIRRNAMPRKVKDYLRSMCGGMADNLFFKTEAELEAERRAKAISGYKALIQKKVGYSKPDAVWELMDAHPYAESLYMKWAKSYE